MDSLGQLNVHRAASADVVITNIFGHLMLPRHSYMVCFSISSHVGDVGEGEVAMWCRTEVTFSVILKLKGTSSFCILFSSDGAPYILISVNF